MSWHSSYLVRSRAGTVWSTAIGSSKSDVLDERTGPLVGFQQTPQLLGVTGGQCHCAFCEFEDGSRPN
jgi:hypothetical protein